MGDPEAGREVVPDLLGVLPDQVLLLDREGRLLYANWVIEGVTMEQILGRSWLDFVPPDQHGVAERARIAAIEQGQPQRYELMAVGPHGTVAWYGAHIRALPDGSGRTVLVARDVTAQRVVEAGLLSADRASTQTALSASLSHELKNPLAAMLANLELIERQLAPMPAAVPELASHLADMRRSALRMERVLADLRLFSGGALAPSEGCDVGEVVATTLRVAANRVRHRALVVCELVPGLRCAAQPGLGMHWPFACELVQQQMPAPATEQGPALPQSTVGSG